MGLSGRGSVAHRTLRMLVPSSSTVSGRVAGRDPAVGCTVIIARHGDRSVLFNPFLGSPLERQETLYWGTYILASSLWSHDDDAMM